MIAIKNADGTLVPVIASTVGADRTVALSLVHSHQKRAEILLFELPDTEQASHIRELAEGEPFGKLVLRRLPDNPFGEVEIQARLSVDPAFNVHVVAGAMGEKTVSGTFRIPSLGTSTAADVPIYDEDEPVPALDDLQIPESESDTFIDDPDDTDWGFDELADPDDEALLTGTDAITVQDDIQTIEEKIDNVPFQEEDYDSPIVQTESDVFIDDPDDKDWGFDELADPEDEVLISGESIVTEDVADSMKFDVEMEDAASSEDETTTNFDDPFGLGPDSKFDPDDKFETDAFETVAFETDDTSEQPSTAESDEVWEQQQAPTVVESEQRKSERVARGREAKTRPETQAWPGLDIGLLRASIVLFVVSVIELGIFVFLRMSNSPM